MKINSGTYWRPLVCISFVFVLGCEQQKTPSAPPVPDIALPETPDVAAKTPASDAGVAESESDADPMYDPRSPIATNLVEFVPETLAGVKARRRTIVKTSPIAHGHYNGPKRKMYNVHITGPNQSAEQRRAAYPLLGTDKTDEMGSLKMKGLKIGDWEGQRTYDKKKKKSEAVLLVNPFVEVKVSAAPTKDPDEAVELLEEIDLEGLSRLR